MKKLIIFLYYIKPLLQYHLSWNILQGRVFEGISVKNKYILEPLHHS